MSGPFDPGDPRTGAGEPKRRETAEAPQERRLEILLVEDSEDDALLIADALRRGGYAPRWRRVESGPELRAALARQEWHAILSDWRLPGFGALDALAICREAGVQARFLIVSGSAEDSFQAEAARAGIAVWVSKDHLERLPGSLAELRIGP